ncbi:MAG: response regulator [Ruminococcus sp.]|nr:response regulator [Ruminococcus sp.]
MYFSVLTIQYISIIVLLFESTYIFRHWRSKIHGYLLLNCAATLVNNAGVLGVMLSDNVDEALTAQKLSYIGAVWIPFSLLVFLIELCGVRASHKVLMFLGTLHAATYLAVVTNDWHQLYYQNISFTKEGVHPHLVYDAGPWHHIYTLLLISYIVYGIMILLLNIQKEKNAKNLKRLKYIAASIIVQVVFYISYISGITEGYNITVLGYSISSVIMLVAIFKYDLLDTLELTREYVVDKLSEGIIAVDTEGRVRYFNEPAKALYPELAEEPAETVEVIAQAISEGETIDIDDRIYTPCVNELEFEGENFGSLYMLVDDTEHYHYMDELREQRQIADRANRAKSAFLANMSHEIRTPINAVLGMDEMILRESGERQVIGYAEDIRTAGRTLLSLINDILDFSKVEQGKMELVPTQYELGSAINDLVNMVRTRADKKGLRFEVEVDSRMPHLLFGDEIRLKQCALNLLTNAVKYTEKGGVKFEVGFEKKSDKAIMLRFTISDTGMGIKEEDMEALFSPFSRIEEGRNRSIEGTGLGMSITQQLLGLMGSKLEVHSTYGEGSVFSFAVEQKVVRWSPIGDYAKRFQNGGRGVHVYHELFHAPNARLLVVDDNAMNLTVFKGLLKKTRIGIDTAASGKEALRLAELNDYDIYFIDHMMPDMDGIETIKRLRAIEGRADSKCIALTANAVSGAREMYIEAGFNDYLSKPIDGERLERMIASMLPADKLETAKAEGGKIQQTSPRILFVDDDPTIRTVASQILGRAFEVTCCATGEEAISLTSRLRPDAVLLDIGLGGMGGFEVLTRLKADPEVRDIPVMFVTGEDSADVETSGFRNGAADFVKKPFAPEVLMQRTKRVVELYHLQKGLKSEVDRQQLRSERLSLEMMLALAKTVDAKDHYTNGHSNRVATYAAELARRLGKSEADQQQIFLMGLMHDIGKIGVSEDILNKNARLTDEEFLQIKRHTVIGSEILSSIKEMPDLAVGARSHHERYDGSGYPDGLAGKDIPEAARIICVADCYDAMTSTRTYSKPKEQEKVRGEFIRCSGIQFDPEIAACMVQMIDDDKDYIMNELGFTEDIWQGSSKMQELRGGESELHGGLESIRGLNVEQGEKNCGGEEYFRITLEAFADSAEEYISDITRFIAEDDRQNAMIKLHSLKGAARTVGAAELGERACEGELYYKGQREEKPDIDGLLRDLNKLAREIKDKLDH